MKSSKTRRILMLLGCAVLLVCLSVGATLAYLTSTDSVENTFTVGKVKITLDETDVDVYGVQDGATRVQKNEYKLIPGHPYTKDPTIHVEAGSEKCWLFVKVVNDIAAIEALSTDDTPNIATQMEKNHWKALVVDGATVENVYYYEYDGNGIVDASTTAVDKVVFSNFTLKNDADVASFVGQDGKVSAKITVDAYAVQADGFDTAAAAWEATFGAPANP